MEVEDMVIPLTVTSTAAQEPIKDCFQDQVITSTESTEESRLSGASLPSGQLSELGDKDPDLDPNVLATDLLRGTELRAECQSSSSTLDGPEHEVHCGRGQCATLPAKEGFEEVGIQSQEVFPAVFSTDITSETELRSECHSSRAVSTSSACECTIHKLVLNDPEPESPVSCKQTAKDASNEKVTVDILDQSASPTKSVKVLKSQVNYCFVCEKTQTKLARHLETHVNENAEVAQALQFSKSSKARKVLLEKLRNLENGGNLAALTFASPQLSETAAQDTGVSSRRCVKRPWSEEEKHMRPFFENGVTVTNGQCLNCKEKEPHKVISKFNKRRNVLKQYFKDAFVLLHFKSLVQRYMGDSERLLRRRSCQRQPGEQQTNN
ncbi:hypothetical protein DNTS_014266, partial [Danionella cerebrum]